jgi:hypothetical protein
VFGWLFRLFPNLKLLTARHQLREFINLPRLSAQFKTLHVCLSDQLDGMIPKKRTYRATCAACETAEVSHDDAIGWEGFSLFD